MKNTKSPSDWQGLSQSSYDRILESLITKNGALEKRVTELETDFQILCITLSVVAICTTIIVYIM